MRDSQVHKNIWCTGCNKEVSARLTDGKEMYPHRADLYEVPFWICDTCGAFVGCHWKMDKPTMPLGVLATKEIKDARKSIHALLDPLWREGKISRGQAYAYISHRIGYTYHSGEIKNLDEAREVYKIVACLRKEIIESKK